MNPHRTTGSASARTTIIRLSPLALPLILAAVPAQASSDAAWAQFNRAVTQKCAAASKLQRPRVSAIVGFDDSLGKVAALVTGIQPQPHLRGATGRTLCIYDKRTRRAWVDEAAGWSAPTAR